MKAVSILPVVPRDQVEALLSRIALASLSIRNLAIVADEDETGACIEGIKALAEKAGFLADSAANLVKGLPASATIGVCGSYPEWAGCNDLLNPKTEKQPAEGGVA